MALTDAAAFLGSIHANHLTEGTRLAASLGLIRVNDPDCWDPWSLPFSLASPREPG